MRELGLQEDCLILVTNAQTLVKYCPLNYYTSFKTSILAMYNTAVKYVKYRTRSYMVKFWKNLSLHKNLWYGIGVWGMY